jgi:two-component system, sensor histidine kinase
MVGVSMAAWFPCEHPDRVRPAQSASGTRLLRLISVSIPCVMALAVMVQVRDGFGWGAVLWQFAMGLLACAAYASWRAGPAHGDAGILTTYSGLYGAGLACGLIGASTLPEQELSALVVVVALTYAAYAVATCYRQPWAALAFSAPLFGASAIVMAWTTSEFAAVAGVAIVLAHALMSLRFLRRKWKEFVHATDVESERLQLSAMLHEQKEIAERAVQLKTRFLASASHDLRQPMHAISLYLDGLAGLDLPESARRAIRDARVCAHDMNEMFRSLLDISRLDAQQAVPSLNVFAVATALSRVEKEFTPLARLRGVRLKVRACPAHVYSDPVMVERIALNFVSNAVRHTPEGRVLVACRARGRVLRLAVYDTGKGIPEREQANIFNEFHRVESGVSPDSTGGLGLGLAIVRRLAQALRAPVTLRSTVGRGSMFAIDLPLVHVSSSSPQPVRASEVLPGKLVVLVDDEVSILQATSFILQEAGCAVIGARSGAEALQSLSSSARIPDAIICDYELLDDCKGPGVIQALREEFNVDIPAMLVTGDTGGGTAEQVARGMGIPVLFKPLEAVALRTSLEALLST